jgi:hypothetical protein
LAVVPFHGTNIMKKIRQMFMKNSIWNSMEFSMEISMEIEIPWNSMKFHELTERFSPGADTKPYFF